VLHNQSRLGEPERHPPLEGQLSSKMVKKKMKKKMKMKVEDHDWYLSSESEREESFAPRKPL